MSGSRISQAFQVMGCDVCYGEWRREVKWVSHLGSMVAF